MRHLRLLPLALLLLLAPLGTAARIDPCLDDHGDVCLHQADGGSPGDASDECAAPSPQVVVGSTFRGWLAAPVDPEDNYALAVPTTSFSLIVSIASMPGLGLPEHALTVWAPSGTQLCQSLVGVARPGEPLAFTANVTGTYTLQVQESDPPLALARPSPQSCHLMCFVANATGYAVSILPG